MSGVEETSTPAPATECIDVSVRPFPPEIAARYAERPEYRHIFTEIFGRGEVLDEGIPLDELFAEMDEHRVTKACVSGYDARTTTGLHVPNEWVADLAREHPENVIPGLGVDPGRRLRETLAEIRFFAENHQFKFIRMVPYAYGEPPDHRRYYPIWALCEELELAVWTQVGHTAGLMPSEPGRPIHLDRVALDFPELRLIGAHIGWPWHDEMIALALKHPNVYVSTCAHAPEYFPETFKQFLRTRGGRKVIYGSNWPFISFERYFRSLDSLDLSPETMRNYLGGNLRRVLDM